MPRKIMFHEPSGRAVLIGFGLCREVGEQKQATDFNDNEGQYISYY